MAEFSEAEKDMLILGVLAGLQINTSDKTKDRPYRQKSRQHQKTTYMVEGRIVCREAFKFLYGISQNKLTPLLKHYLSKGVTPRQKPSWGGRKYNTNALSDEDTTRVVMFLTHLAEDHALNLPGRIPGFKRQDVRILPSAMTKVSIWRHYKLLAAARGWRVVGRSSFFNLWQQYLPTITVGRPMTDLCGLCKSNNEKVRRSSNLPEELKCQILSNQIAHLDAVQEERQLYKQMNDEAKIAAAQAGITELGPNPPNSRNLRFHYSFDFAQQVHLPSSPLQPGPIYFLVPRKCGIFGVCAEGFPQQVNYLIDEGMSCSKGSNIVISLLHHFLSNYGIGESGMDAHCDNCSGQNKNKFVLWYCCWRVLLGLHDEITLNFMPAGHTKFSPDWCFGILKQKLRREEVVLLEDMCRIVNTSTQRGINRAHLVGTAAGDVLVPVYDWQAHFGDAFKPLKGIKQMYHFRFQRELPGIVEYKAKLGDGWKRFQICHPEDVVPDLAGMPAEIPPPGLEPQRREYLRTQVGKFVPEHLLDRLCP